MHFLTYHHVSNPYHGVPKQEVGPIQQGLSKQKGSKCEMRFGIPQLLELQLLLLNKFLLSISLLIIS